MTSTIKVNNIQNQCGANIINESSNTITIGASGDTIALASGASQTGFGRTGTVDWDTTAKTASFTAVSGNGYFVNTTSGAITVTLPASPSAGDIVSIADYAGTAATNNITIARNGSNFEGGTVNGQIVVNRQSVTLIYVDGTQGWVPTSENDSSFQSPLFVTATGGTVTTCGNFKIHTFTGPGTFCVSSAGNSSGSNSVDYLVVAGGGGGSANASGGGGGGGGFRESSGAASGCYTASPLGANVSALPVSASPYPITVGGGGAGGTPGSPDSGVNGVNSVFSTITSAGGGRGSQDADGGDGGSGGGQRYWRVTRPSGNTPPVSPPQGQDGGIGSPNGTGGNYPAGGGGGATEQGVDGPPNAPSPSGRGGAGGTTSISASPVAYAGGGGGGGYTPGGNAFGAASPCGTGGAGNGSAGTTNRGGGGGGTNCSANGGAGGSGIVIIRYKFQ